MCLFTIAFFSSYTEKCSLKTKISLALARSQRVLSRNSFSSSRTQTFFLRRTLSWKSCSAEHIHVSAKKCPASQALTVTILFPTMSASFEPNFGPSKQQRCVKSQTLPHSSDMEISPEKVKRSSINTHSKHKQFFFVLCYGTPRIPSPFCDTLFPAF